MCAKVPSRWGWRHSARQAGSPRFCHLARSVSGLAPGHPSRPGLLLDTKLDAGVSTWSRRQTLKASRWPASTPHKTGENMFKRIFKPWLRPMACLGALSMAFTQVACAHPVDAAPSVVISSRIGHAPVLAHIGVPMPLVVMPPPGAWQVPPPRLLYAAPVHVPAPVWGYGHGRRQHHGHGHWRGQFGPDQRGQGHPGHGHRSGWGR